MLILLTSGKQCESVITNKTAGVRYGNFGVLEKFWVGKIGLGAQYSMPALMLVVTRPHRIQQNLHSSSILECTVKSLGRIKHSSY
jgi:hypothetical protein